MRKERNKIRKKTKKISEKEYTTQDAPDPREIHAVRLQMEKEARLESRKAARHARL